jgi:hypothetical protein
MLAAMRSLSIRTAGPDGPGRLTELSSASHAVIEFDDLARAVRALRPPAAYRLSLDSGVAYRNVRNAIARPQAARVQTWLRLLASLRLRLIAAPSAEDLIWPGTHTPVVALDGVTAGHLAWRASPGLRAHRQAAGRSRSALARRAGMSTDCLESLESGLGRIASLEAACQAMGLRLLVALPLPHRSLASLWAERAPALLQAPARFPCAPHSRGRSPGIAA